MSDQEVNKTIEVLRKELLKRGLTEEQATEAIQKTKLTDDDIKTLLQEAKSFEDEIKEVELSTIPALAQEGYDLNVEVAKLTQKLVKVQNGAWFEEWVIKTFPAIKKATDKFDKVLSERVESLTSKKRTDELIRDRGEAFDFQEVKLENELKLYRFKRDQFPKIDAEFNVTIQMREDFMKATAQQEKLKVTPIIEKIDELNDKIMFIKETIAKTLFISLEEAHLVIVANNFFSTVFDTLTTIERTHSTLVSDAMDAELDNIAIGFGWIERNLSNSFPFKVLKANVSKAYAAKQDAMKARLEELRAKKEDN